jgi:hypothetical protein
MPPWPLLSAAFTTCTYYSRLSNRRNQKKYEGVYNEIQSLEHAVDAPKASNKTSGKDAAEIVNLVEAGLPLTNAPRSRKFPESDA